MKHLTGENAKRVNQDSPLFGQLKIGEYLKNLPNLVVKAGKAAAANVDLSAEMPNSIALVLAFTTATGAPAAKTLLAATTDYTYANGALKCVTDQSANTLVIVFK